MAHPCSNPPPPFRGLLPTPPCFPSLPSDGHVVKFIIYTLHFTRRKPAPRSHRRHHHAVLVSTLQFLAGDLSFFPLLQQHLFPQFSFRPFCPRPLFLWGFSLNLHRFLAKRLRVSTHIMYTVKVFKYVDLSFLCTEESKYSPVSKFFIFLMLRSPTFFPPRFLLPILFPIVIITAPPRSQPWPQPWVGTYGTVFSYASPTLLVSFSHVPPPASFPFVTSPPG